MTGMISIEPLDGAGSFSAYCAEPAGTPRAAIIVIQEIFGVNAGIQRKCDVLAEAGYLAIAPDLFWRLEPGILLDPDVPEQFQQALAWMGKFDQDAGCGTSRRRSAPRGPSSADGGKVGAVGYCLGGRLAFMTATRTDVNASVGYYGVGIDNLLGEKHAIAHPCCSTFRRRITSSTRPRSSGCMRGSTITPRSRSTTIPVSTTASRLNSASAGPDESAKLADERDEQSFYLAGKFVG